MSFSLPRVASLRKSFGKLCLGSLVALLGFVMPAGATPITFSSPLSLSSPGVIGTAYGQSSTTFADYDDIAQQILDLGLAANVTISGRTYKTSTTTDYSGTIAPNQPSSQKTDVPEVANGGPIYIASGWTYVMAKYDGQNAGFVLFYLGGSDAYIPRYPYNFWTTNSTKYAISNYTVFNPHTQRVSDNAATLLLTAGGLLAACALMRRRGLNAS
jgi:hypothetical protein